MKLSSRFTDLLTIINIKWKNKFFRYVTYSIVTIILFIIVFSLFINLYLAPRDFPINSIFTIAKGAGLTQTADNLYTKNIIRSKFWFKSFSVLFGGLKGIIAGDYDLNKQENAITLAWRFSQGDYSLVPIKITFPEGLNVMEMSKLISQKFLKIDPAIFVKLASSSEGYLFPDTYYLLPNVSSMDIVKIMKETFDKKIITLNNEIISFNKPLADIIKMASIVEEEARTTETRQIVAGILWKRLASGMPLQVDSSFKYINGKGTKDLTLADLKKDSPYNSYTRKGLPPTPITNPGIDTIRDTITPIKTNYLYFLSDKKGEMHYASTYAEHLKNKALYLPAN